MDGANRAFLLLTSLAAAAYVVLGFWGCGALVTVLTALLADGSGAMVGAGAWELWSGVLLAALELTVSLAGIVSVQRQLVATEGLAGWVRRNRTDIPPRVAEVVGGRRLRHRVDVVATDELVSFTYGFLRPRIVVSQGLLRTSSRDELAAVLEHEAYHVRNLDPLKMAVARALPAAFFFLPLLGDLRDRYLLGRELAADRRSAARCGVEPLAGALAKAVGTPGLPQPAAGAALGGGRELLPARVAQLETGVEPGPPLPSRRQVVLTAASILVLGTVLAMIRGLGWGVGAHLHAPPMGAVTTAPSAVATGLCLAFWAWVVWRVVRWSVARPR
ncbi:MAG: M56 family metallopeptidase [Actinobacteria bacterium]|nr:M56 family metallopeptidase [Actinomycetota bacterium]